MSKIRAIITPEQKVLIKRTLNYVHRIRHHRSIINSKKEWLKISEKNHDVYFGYYDISPFNSRNQLIYVKKKKGANELKICLNSTYNLANEKQIATSYAWNWQQGCRLRWFPGSDNKIVFNNYQNGKYFSTVVDTNGDVLQNYSYPLYDIDHNGTLGLTLDFERLGELRPGYGYTCRKYVANNLAQESIKIIDLAHDCIIDEVTYRNIANSMPVECKLEKCYINHLSFSPNGKKFLFFWIEIVNGYHQASLMVYDIIKKSIITLDTKEKVSHYVWLDDENIICTAYESPAKCRYYLYNVLDSTKTPYCPNALQQDGHPSIYKEGAILTDTYPDSNGFQHLYLVNTIEDTKQQLLEIYSMPVANGEWRTDLHPRFNIDKTLICFDSNINGFRELFIVKNK